MSIFLKSPDPPDHIVREAIGMGTRYWSTKHSIFRPYYETRRRMKYTPVQAWEYLPGVVLPQGHEGTAADGGGAISDVGLEIPVAATLTSAMCEEIRIVCGLSPNGMPLHRHYAAAECFQSTVNWNVQGEFTVLRFLGRTAYETLTEDELERFGQLLPVQQLLDTAGADPMKRIFTHIFVTLVKGSVNPSALDKLDEYADAYGSWVEFQIMFVSDIIEEFVAEEKAIDKEKTLLRRRRDVLALI